MLKFIKKLFKIDEPMFMLGRWCHVNVPKCNHNVILKKIDFANSDNNLSYKANESNKANKDNKANKNNKNNTKNNKSLSPQEYIDGFNN